MMKQTRPPFLFVPPQVEQQAYITLRKISWYVKAMEECLVRAGICGFREVEKIAMRNEALEAIEQINGQLDKVRSQIGQIPDDMERDKITLEWDSSPDRARLKDALADYNAQLAEALGDDI